MMTTVEADGLSAPGAQGAQGAQGALANAGSDAAVAPAPADAAAGDHFIPLRKTDIISALAREDGGVGGSDFEQFCRLVSAIMHYEYYRHLEELRDDYFYFNPEVAAELRDAPEGVDLDASYARLVAGFEEVMSAANFESVPVEEARERDADSLLGSVTLKFDPDRFREIRVYRRGRHSETLTQRKWFGLFKRRFEAEIYDNVVLFMAVKPSDEVKGRKRRDQKMPPGSVIIKFFKNIPKADLRTLFPDARVVMGRRDFLTLGVPALAGVAWLGIKLLPALGVILLVLGGYLGAQGSIEDDRLKEALAAVSVVAAFGAFLGRQWMNYQRTSLNYQKMISETVYYRNINNNSGIFEFLIGAAEEQEIKECVLAYHFISSSERPLTQTELDARIEQWLRQRFRLDLDFEVHDAVAKLERLGVAQTASDGTITALPPGSALTELDRRWDNYFQFNR